MRSAFLASAEITVFSLRAHRTGLLPEEGIPGAVGLSRRKADPRRLLATILVGTDIASMEMSAITTTLLTEPMNTAAQSSIESSDRPTGASAL